MSKTVYVLGAGVNQTIKDDDELSPPLSNNFFQIVLRKPHRFREKDYISEIQKVCDYIAQYWKIEKEALKSTPFDLEECFTMLELQIGEAGHRRDRRELCRLRDIQDVLFFLVAQIFSSFENDVTALSTKQTMNDFGQVLYSEKPVIITFNYDCNIERAIENASGTNPSVSKLRDEGKILFEKEKMESMKSGKTELEALRRFLPHEPIRKSLFYSDHNWVRPLGYGIKFDRIQKDFPGLSSYVDGETFYALSGNELYSWYILKLHGSLNWLSLRPSCEAITDRGKAKTFLKSEYWDLTLEHQFDGQHVMPIIITPVPNKDFFHPLYSHIFPPIWEKAKDALSTCKRLVVIGYSFPPTDFSVKKLFLEAFSENTLEELTVVNPDTAIVQKVKNFCHFRKPITVCENLDEFLRLYN